MNRGVAATRQNASGPLAGGPFIAMSVRGPRLLVAALGVNDPMPVPAGAALAFDAQRARAVVVIEPVAAPAAVVVTGRGSHQAVRPTRDRVARFAVADAPPLTCVRLRLSLTQEHFGVCR